MFKGERVQGEVGRNIDDIGWTAFNTGGEEDNTVTPAENDETYNEYKYSASGLNEFSTFQIKIVMVGTNSAYPPIIRDCSFKRAIRRNQESNRKRKSCRRKKERRKKN